MNRARVAIAILGALALVALVLVVVAASGGNGDGAATTSVSPPVQAPIAPPSGDVGDLPPGFVECMADQGYEVSSPEDIHAAPPEVLQACFGASH